MQIRVVYARATMSLMTEDGANVPVRMGSHWPAEDPLVLAHPDQFSGDPRFGMSWTGTPPAYMSLPPDAPLPADGLPPTAGAQAPARGRGKGA